MVFWISKVVYNYYRAFDASPCSDLQSMPGRAPSGVAGKGWEAARFPALRFFNQGPQGCICFSFLFSFEERVLLLIYKSPNHH